MGLGKLAANLAASTSLFFSERGKYDRGFLVAYLRFMITHELAVKTFRRRILTEKLKEFSVEFLDYSTFLAMFRSVFLDKEYFFECSSAKPNILDCGANVGMSLLFFKQLYPSARITAFEPDRRVFEVLKKNVLSNALANVELVPRALSDKKGEIDFFFDPDRIGSLHMSIFPERMSKSHEKVACDTLSSYISDKVDFLKLDTEGAEPLILRELSASGKIRLIEKMVIEYHHHIDTRRNDLSTFLNLLESNGFGYQIASSLRTPFEPHKFQDLLIYAYRT